MISKINFVNLIGKYSLNSLIESVNWTVEKELLTIRFMNPNKDMLGELQYSNFPLEDIKLSIFDTTQLLKLVNVCSGDLMINIGKHNHVNTKLFIDDTSYTLSYSLADTLLIPKVATVDEPEEYCVNALLSDEQISNIIKAKNALETNHITIKTNTSLNNDRVLQFIIGEPQEHANTISYEVLATITKELEMSFDANVLNEILKANKTNLMAKLFISSEGLMKLEFLTNETKTKYLLVKKNDNN